MKRRGAHRRAAWLPGLVLLLGASLLAAACGRSDSFQVTASIDGLGVETLTLAYFADGHLQQVNAHPPEAGEPAVFEGKSDSYTLARLLRADGTVVATFTVRNGDEVTIATTPRAEGAEKGGSPLPRFGGSAAADSLEAFFASHARLVAAGPSGALNDTIAAYLGRNPRSAVSTLLLVSLFDAATRPEAADSLYNLLDISAKTPGLVDGWAEQLSMAVPDNISDKIAPLTLYGREDSTVTFVATAKSYSLLAFLAGNRHDSIDSPMRALRKNHRKQRLQMIEIDMNADSASWNVAARRDSATWQRAWMPAGNASPALRRLNLPSFPFFIVADSTGRQLYRGRSASGAASFLNNLLTPPDADKNPGGSR